MSRMCFRRRHLWAPVDTKVGVELKFPMLMIIERLIPAIRIMLPAFAAPLKGRFELPIMGSGDLGIRESGNISYTFGHSRMGTDRYDLPWGGP